MVLHIRIPNKFLLGLFSLTGVTVAGAVLTFHGDAPIASKGRAVNVRRTRTIRVPQLLPAEEARAGKAGQAAVTFRSRVTFRRCSRWRLEVINFP
jgi:hypothetical protein